MENSMNLPSKLFGRIISYPFPILCFCMLFLGCATSSSSSYSTVRGNSIIDSGAYQTYGWMPTRLSVSGSPELTNRETQNLIRKEVNNYFRRNGMRMTTQDDADLLVTFHAAVDDEMRVSYMDPHFEYAPGWKVDPQDRTASRARGEYFSRTYRRGSLTLELYSGSTGRIVWRGTTEEVFKPRSTRYEREYQAREVIRELLQKL